MNLGGYSVINPLNHVCPNLTFRLAKKRGELQSKQSKRDQNICGSSYQMRSRFSIGILVMAIAFNIQLSIRSLLKCLCNENITYLVSFSNES
jgi:hypothetical protein